MLITSPQKKVRSIKVANFEQKDYIKYLGVYIGKHITWQHQIKQLIVKLLKIRALYIN